MTWDQTRGIHGQVPIKRGYAGFTSVPSLGYLYVFGGYSSKSLELEPLTVFSVHVFILSGRRALRRFLFLAISLQTWLVLYV